MMTFALLQSLALADKLIVDAQVNCQHPDHETGTLCRDRAVACNEECSCCLDPHTVEIYRLNRMNNNPHPLDFSSPMD